MATKEEIAQNEQFLLLSLCFQLYLIIVLSLKGSFHCFSGMISKSSAADLFVCGKGFGRNGRGDLLAHVIHKVSSESSLFACPFHTYRRFLTSQRQTTFENVITKEEIAHTKQFLLLS